MDNDSQWVEEDGVLTQTFECEDFRSAVDLFNRIAVVAEEREHHPDMMIHDLRLVSVMLVTHEEGAVTDADYALAAEIDEVITEMDVE